MAAPVRRTLNIDDPLAAPEACHVARSAPEPTGDRRLREIPLTEIHPNPDQPRRHFDADALDALAGSIRERGVLQPIIVQPRRDNGYQLIAGERRWRAAQIAELTEIPALVDEAVDGAVSLELALIENLARADLTVIEEARAIASLLDDLAVSRADLARRLGRSRSDIAHTVRLLELPDNTIDMIGAGTLSKGHGKALLVEPDHHRRRALARRAAEAGWSVRQLESEIARVTNSKPTRPAASADQVEAGAALAELISRATGCEARVRPHPHGYQVILEPSAAAGLTRFLQRGG
jgi:ParB family chromosome partitioning protein